MLYGCTVLLCFNTALQTSIAFESLTRHICDPLQISPNFSKNNSNLSPQGSSKWNLSSLDFTMPAGKDLKLRILPKNSWVLTDRDFRKKTQALLYKQSFLKEGMEHEKQKRTEKVWNIYILKKNNLKHFCRKNKFPKTISLNMKDSIRGFKPSSLQAFTSTRRSKCSGYTVSIGTPSSG